MAETKGFRDRLTGTTYNLKDATAREGVATNAEAIAALAETVPAVDDDLDTAGAAADAKAAGDAIAAVDGKVETVAANARKKYVPSPVGDWSRGTLNPSTGGSSDSTATNRIRTAWSGENIPLSVAPLAGYKVAVYVKLSGTYEGVIQADGSIAKSNYYSTGAVSLESVANLTDVRFQLMKTDEGNIALADGANLLGTAFTDKSLSQAGKAADAKAVTDLIARDSVLHNLIYTGTMLEDYYMTSTPASATTPVPNTGMITTDFIPVKGGETIVCHNFRRYWWYKSDKSVVSDSSTGNLSDRDVFDTVTGAKLLKAPQSAAYIRVCYRAVASDQSEADTDVYLYRPTGYDLFLYSCIYQGIGKKYVALGSSSVAGTYSEIGNPQSVGIDPNVSFVRWIAEYNGYTIVNYGAGGQGWRNKSKQSAGGMNAAETVDAHYVPTANPPLNDFADADIITLYFGTNDWKSQWGASDTDAGDGWTLGDMTSEAATDGTVIGAMKYTLEKLITAAPQAQIVVIIPGNFKKLGNAKTGDESNPEISVVDGISYAKVENSYAMGTHNVKGDTLADYHAAIKACAEYYGVRVVSVGEICAANLLNIDYKLGDGIHPTPEYYKQMGLELAPYCR